MSMNAIRDWTVLNSYDVALTYVAKTFPDALHRSEILVARWISGAVRSVGAKLFPENQIQMEGSSKFNSSGTITLNQFNF